MSGLEQELIDVMLDVIVLEPATGKNRFNDLTFGPPVAARCQMVRMNKRTVDIAGREVTSTLQAILADPTLVVSPDDHITLSDGSHPAIIAILAAKDDEGPYYLEIRA